MTNLIDHEPVTSSTTRLTHDASNAKDIVKNWHHETHVGPFYLCFEQPCHAVAFQAGEHVVRSS